MTSQNIDMRDATRKIVIAGTGRCGTTFLVQLLTLLGLPTGITYTGGRWLMTCYQRPIMNEKGYALSVDRKPPPKWKAGSGMVDNIRAGLEYHFSYSDTITSLAALPKVIKNPRFAYMSERLLAENRIKLDYVLACVRSLDEVAASKFESGKLHPRERYYQKSTEIIRVESAVQLGEFTATLVCRDIPHSFIVFPKMINDPDYLFTVLAPILSTKINLIRFRLVHGELAKKDFVHHRK